MNEERITRRRFCSLTGAAGLAAATHPLMAASGSAARLRYILGSCMYGTAPLEKILPEAERTGAEHIDIWPRPHGNQREQIERMGVDRFAEMLEKHNVKLGILTHYDLGPFKLQDEMAVARKLGGTMLICGGSGPRGLKGKELKSAVKRFAEKMKPHVAAAEEHGVTIGIENHGNNLIESPDSMRWLAEFAPSPNIGIALAPYHLPQDPQLIARLIEDLGDGLVHFYAWQHGKGAMKKRPKEQELLQMPGRGSLDFTPIMAALDKIGYQGWVEPFMHPVPRGIPILEPLSAVTEEINRSRRYLEKCAKRA